MPTPSVALVTGATRGAGKGIALGLAAKGLTVYVTGRSKQIPTATLKGETLSGTLTRRLQQLTLPAAPGLASPAITVTTNKLDG